MHFLLCSQKKFRELPMREKTSFSSGEGQGCLVRHSCAYCLCLCLCHSSPGVRHWGVIASHFDANCEQRWRLANLAHLPFHRHWHSNCIETVCLSASYTFYACALWSSGTEAELQTLLSSNFFSPFPFWMHSIHSIRLYVWMTRLTRLWESFGIALDSIGQ